MTSDDLSREQLHQLHRQVEPLLGFLSRLCRRLDARRFPVSDPLRVRAMKAQEAVLSLRIHLHYSACAPGMSAALQGRQGHVPAPTDADVGGSSENAPAGP